MQDYQTGCKHYWQFVQAKNSFEALPDTPHYKMVEYAYYYCTKCLRAKKSPVKEHEPDKNYGQQRPENNTPIGQL